MSLIAKKSLCSLTFLKNQNYATEFLHLQNEGFNAKASNWQWTEEERKKLKKYLAEIAANPMDVTVNDVFYYLSHYKFQGVISSKNVRKEVYRLHKENKSKRR